MKINFEEMPEVVAIVGSREFPRLDAVETFVKRLRPGTLVISGGADGVDHVAEVTAYKRRDLPNPNILRPNKDLPIPERFFLRNEEIVAETKRLGGVVFAFELVSTKTKGTQNTLKHCKKLDVAFVNYRMDGNNQWLQTVYSPHWTTQPNLMKVISMK